MYKSQNQKQEILNQYVATYVRFCKLTLDLHLCFYERFNMCIKA